MKGMYGFSPAACKLQVHHGMYLHAVCHMLLHMPSIPSKFNISRLASSAMSAVSMRLSSKGELKSIRGACSCRQGNGNNSDVTDMHWLWSCELQGVECSGALD